MMKLSITESSMLFTNTQKARAVNRTKLTNMNIVKPDKSEYENMQAPANPKQLSIRSTTHRTTTNTMGMCTHNVCLASNRVTISCSWFTISSSCSLFTRLVMTLDKYSGPLSNRSKSNPSTTRATTLEMEMKRSKKTRINFTHIFIVIIS